MIDNTSINALQIKSFDRDKLDHYSSYQNVTDNLRRKFQDYGIQFQRIALRKSQIVEFGLDYLKNPDPEVLQKLLRNSNANAFIDENGSLYQIETDALQKDPKKLRKLVLDSVDQYFSDDIYQELLNKFSQKNIYDLVTEKIRQFSNCRRSYDDNNELEEES